MISAQTYALYVVPLLLVAASALAFGLFRFTLGRRSVRPEPALSLHDAKPAVGLATPAVPTNEPLGANYRAAAH